MLRISVAKVNDFNPWNKAFFNTEKISSFHDLANIAVTTAWSPIVWKNGRRCVRNYDSCSFLALDYDSGVPTMDDLIRKIERSGLMFFVGTTKSHQKPKADKKTKEMITCDRFRLVVPLKDQPSRVAMQFKWQMAAMMRRWPAPDESCKDQARFFFPCTDIVKIRAGSRLSLPEPPTVEQMKKRIEKRRQKVERAAKAGKLPIWVDSFLNRGEYKDSRRMSCFSVSAELARFGWSLPDVQNAVLSAPFPKTDLSHSDIKDLPRHIQNGYQKGHSNG